MEEEKVRVRRAKKKEFKEILKIENKELYPELTESQLKEWMEGEDIFSPQSFVILSDDKVIGSCTFEVYELRRNEIIISLDMIVVSEDFQRKRFGSKLLLESIKEAKNYWNSAGFEVRGLIIETGTDEAGGFYEKVFRKNFNFQKTTIENIWSDGEGIVHYFIHF